MHRPGNRIIPGLRSAVRPQHAMLPPLLGGPTAGWHTAFAERLRGPLDRAALQAALDAVAARQDVLRYRIVQGTGVVDAPGPVPLHDDLADLATRPFAAGRRLWRAALHRVAPDEHVLAFAGHRAVFDERTQALLYAELATAYRGNPLPPLPTGFAGYVAWRAGRRAPADLLWWSAHLDGATALDLPTDATAVPAAGTGHAETVLDPATTAGIAGLARSFGATPAAVLLAALGVVLARLAGQSDLLVGTPMVGPRSPAFEPLLGGLVDIAPLRLRPAPESTFASLIRQVRDELLEALAHPTVGPVPATRVLFEAVDAEAPALDLPGLSAEPVPMPVPTPVDLSLRCVPEGHRLRLAAAYHADRYRPERIAALLAALGTLLAQAVHSPGRSVAEFALRPDDQPAPDADQTVVDRLGRRAAVGELGEIVVRWAGGWLGTGRAGRYRPDGTVEPAGPVPPGQPDAARVRALETGRR
jgi:mycobactin peptide synthetase MbtE